MRFEEVFTITGRGTVANGLIEINTVKLGDEVQIIRLNEEVKNKVTGIYD